MKQFKVLLINPLLSLEDRYGKNMKYFGSLSEPLALAYLAANLELHDYPVKILDCPALMINTEGIIEELKKENYNLVGLTMLTPMHSVVKQLTRKIKKACPQTKIIIGGAHVTALPIETLEEIESIDYISIGEGENTIVELARALEEGKEVRQVDGLAYRDKDKIVLTQPREFEKDLDRFPLPARHLLPMEKYKSTASTVQGRSFCATLIIARGCPFNCSFCSHPFGRSFRHHSVERIIQEIEYLIKDYNVSEFNIEADTLTVNRDFILYLCQEIVKRGLNKKIQWTCASRMDSIDEELLKKMKEAGCWQISYGVESGVQRLLDLINKGEKLEDMEKAFSLTKKVGITIRGFFMLGLPTETREESLQTIKFAKKLDPLWAQFTITTPFPGTPMFEELKRKGEIRSFNWDYYNTWGGWTEKEVAYLPQNRTMEELKLLQKKAVTSFYLRPKVIFRFIKTIRSWSVFKKYLRGGLTVLKVKFLKNEKE